MSKRTPKNSQIEHNTPVVLCWHTEFFENNKNQKLKHGSYYDLLNNLNISYINHVTFEIHKEIYDKCKSV